MSVTRKEEYRSDLGYLAELKDLRAGDILLFRSSIHLARVQYVIMGAQAILKRQKHGHYDTTHVAICIGHENGKAMIAHVTEFSNTMGFIIEPIDLMLTRENKVQDRSFLVFRAKDKFIADAYAKEAAKSENIIREWSLFSGVKSFLNTCERKLTEPVKEKERIDKNVICSQFVIQVIQAVTQQQDKIGFITHLNYYPNIKATSPPKVLEAELYNNRRYDMFCYTGKESPFQIIKMEIKSQLSRLNTKVGKKAADKYKTVLSEYKNLRKQLRKIKFENELEKALYLLKSMIPVLSIRVGLFEARSYKAVMASARQLGIFKRDVEQFDLKKMEERVPPFLTFPRKGGRN